MTLCPVCSETESISWGVLFSKFPRLLEFSTVLTIIMHVVGKARYRVWKFLIVVAINWVSVPCYTIKFSQLVHAKIRKAFWRIIRRGDHLSRNRANLREPEDQNSFLQIQFMQIVCSFSANDNQTVTHILQSPCTVLLADLRGHFANCFTYCNMRWKADLRRAETGTDTHGLTGAGKKPYQAWTYMLLAVS